MFNSAQNAKSVGFSIMVPFLDPFPASRTPLRKKVASNIDSQLQLLEEESAGPPAGESCHQNIGEWLDAMVAKIGPSYLPIASCSQWSSTYI